ncbi:hypothetical protein LTR74_000872 [Friedmanniomyces endolithicus]|nr:hypothetical protein LTR74_000872 [Friedmanniomyces endolithicus]
MERRFLDGVGRYGARREEQGLEVSADGSSARFYGCLDIKTLGGAGFASQKTSGEWDLGEYVGVRVKVEKGDKLVCSCLLLAMVLLMIGAESAIPVRGDPSFHPGTAIMICHGPWDMWSTPRSAAPVGKSGTSSATTVKS